MQNSYPGVGLKVNSFSPEPDANIFYKGQSFDSVYNQLSEDIRKGAGIVLLTGEEGSGKTSVLKEISHQLNLEVRCIYDHAASIHHFDDLLRHICNELKLESVQKTSLDKIQALDEFLSKTKQINPNIALIIDDAHQLHEDVLSNILLLSSPPSDESVSFQIVLSGSPELEDKVENCKLPSNEQFQVYRHHLECLDSSGVGAFISKHLEVMGDDYKNVFTPEAISRIADYSSGNPLKVKKVCATALSVIGDEVQHSITEELIDRITAGEILVTIVPVSQIATPESKVGKSPDLINDAVTPAERLQGVESAENTNLSSGENSAQGLDENTSKHWFAIGTGALILIVVLIMFFQSITHPVLDSMQTSQLEVESVGQAQLLDDDSGQSNQTDLSGNNSGAAKRPREVLFADPDIPGNTARAYIANLESDSKPVDLDTIYDYAEQLSKQNKPDDVYLLYFYAANQGHSNAAFRLAQMADPATFTKGSTIHDKPNVMEANKWYLQAVKAGHPKAEFYLTRLNSQLIKKADAGDVEAQRMLLYFKK